MSTKRAYLGDQLLVVDANETDAVIEHQFEVL